MARQLDETTLLGAAKHYAGMFQLPDTKTAGGAYIQGPKYVAQDFYRFTFRDEFEFMCAQVRDRIGGPVLDEFNAMAAEVFTPRDDETFESLLAEHLAIDTDGKHIAGRIGKVEIGTRLVGTKQIEVESLDSIRRRKRLGLPVHVAGRDDREIILKTVKDLWPVYAGEGDERAANSGVADPLPPGAVPLPLSATNPRISNEAAIAAADAIVDLLDEGTTAAEIRGRDGSQPAGVDETETGTLLFTLPMSDPAFGNAADGTPGGVATASAITDDSSADATGTLGYCRCAATGTGADDHIDGEAGTSGADFNFNTLSIVSGSTVSMSSFTLTVPES